MIGIVKAGAMALCVNDFLLSLTTNSNLCFALKTIFEQHFAVFLIHSNTLNPLIATYQNLLNLSHILHNTQYSQTFFKPSISYFLWGFGVLGFWGFGIF